MLRGRGHTSAALMCSIYVLKLGQAGNLSTRLVLCGTFLETFNFNFLGMAGYALGEEADSRVKSLF